jgi:hypothetical protein
MQQLAHKNPWKTVFVIVVFVFLTTALSTAGAAASRVRLDANAIIDG